MTRNVSIAQLGPDAQRQVVAQLSDQPRRCPKCGGREGVHGGCECGHLAANIPPIGKPRKYRNVPTEYKSVQGFVRKYDSKREAEYAALLDTQRDVLWWLPQVRIPLPGGVVYVLDFLVCRRRYATPRMIDLEFIDVKGFMTPASKAKIKQVKALYDIDVEIVR